MNTSEKELKKYFATVSVGLEETLALELKNLGAKKINLGRI